MPMMRRDAGYFNLATLVVRLERLAPALGVASLVFGVWDALQALTTS